MNLERAAIGSVLAVVVVVAVQGVMERCAVVLFLLLLCGSLARSITSNEKAVYK